MDHSIPLDDIMSGTLAVITLLFSLTISVIMWREKNKDSVIWMFISITTFLTTSLAVYITAKGYAWFTSHILYLP
jgi:cellobiose-specific phosphotransferase system component IIC